MLYHFMISFYVYMADKILFILIYFSFTQLLFLTILYLKQAAGNTIEDVKIKGLFCLLAKNGVYGFSAFGLYSQEIKAKYTNADSEDINTSVLPGLFQLPWFCTELSGSMVPIRVTDKTAPKRGGNFSDPSDGNLSEGKLKPISKPSRGRLQGTAENLATANRSMSLRFSRYSNPTEICGNVSHSNDQLQRESDEIFFLTLCRVLIKRMRSIKGTLG
jgi:hypothetical protein